MTSTNDGKEVKSNQTSGPKGKTYFIELFRSLDARLTEAGSASERTKHLCEAWRRVHNLCLHSTTSAHTHLLSWLQRHTARTILQTGWQLPERKDDRTSLSEAINVLIVESRSAAAARDGVSPPWEVHLVARGEWFKTVLDQPWQHPVLTCLLNPDGTPPTDDEVLEWLKEERGITFVVRLQTLVAEKCDDIAVSLATAVMERARRGTHHSDIEETQENKEEPDETSASFENRLKKDAGFTVDVYELLTDIEFMLLHKRDSSRCIALAKQTPLPNAYKLIERLQSRLETSPREKRLWKNSKEVALLITQVVIARCMVIPQCTGVARSALYRCAHLLARLTPTSRLPAAAAALAAPAPTAAHLHTLAAAIDAQLAQKNETSMKPFVCELYVRAITAGMNELERLKLKTEKETEARSMEQTLASWFVQLGSVLASSHRFKCECALTAFSVHPSPKMYEKIKAAPALPPIHLESVEQTSSEAINPEFGSWASDSRSQTNFVKTSETLNMKARQNQANVLSTAILNEGEALGLSPELCQDIIVLLSGPRVKTLSWDMDRDLLLENCRVYLERTHGGTKAVTTELKYLNLNPADFEYLPEEDEDENNIYYGIEKGYEHLVEPTPEDIWEDAYEHFETADTTYSSDEFDFITPQRKKKTKKHPTPEEDDPLSYVAETKRKEKKERPHSKERSKEKKKNTDKVPKEKKIPEDPLNINEDNQDRNIDKPKKERKKKEKVPKHTDGSLSSLVGLKVGKPKKKSKNVTDSDADSQGKSSIQSMNSEETVLYDGMYSMDETKSPRSSHSSDGHMQNNFSNTYMAHQSHFNRPRSDLPIGSPAYMLQSASEHSRNESPPPITDEVKSSITKLLEFRRLKALEDRKKPNAILRPEGSLAIHAISPKGVAIPEIPKSYINKQQSEMLIEKQKLNSLLKQRKQLNTAIPSPVIQYARKNLNPGQPSQSQFNNSSQYNMQTDRMTPSSDRCFSTPPMDRSDKFLDSVSLISIYDKDEPSYSRSPFPARSPCTGIAIDKDEPSYSRSPFPARSPCTGIAIQRSPKVDKPDINYQDYLHEFHKQNTFSKFAEKNEPTKKVIRPTNRITPLVPNLKSEQKAPQSAKQMPQKKPDGSLNTFSRLSYFKNKQTDKVNKSQDMSQLNKPQTMGSKLDGFIMDHLNQFQHDKQMSQAVDAHALNRKYEKPQTSAKEHPIIANILSNPSSAHNQQQSVSPQKTVLSEKDQNDLLLLLRQQIMLNKPQNSPVASCSNLNFSTQNNVSCSKTSSTAQVYESNSGLMSSNPNVTSPTNPQISLSSNSTNIPSKTPNTSLISLDLQKGPISGNSQIEFKHNESKVNENKINIISTSIIKSADPKKVAKPKLNVNTKKPMGQGKPKKSENKEHKQDTGRSAATAHKHPEEWENVMNAILKQKTPCRGPNALDMALNKSSFEKAFEESLRKPGFFGPRCISPSSSSVSSIEYNQEEVVKITKTRTTSTSVTIINTQKKTHTLLKTEIRAPSEPKKHSRSKKSATKTAEKVIHKHKIEPKLLEKLIQQNNLAITGINSNLTQIRIPEKIMKQSSNIKHKNTAPDHVAMQKPQNRIGMPKQVAETPKKDIRKVFEQSCKQTKGVDTYKKEPLVKQLTSAGSKQDDPFISGLQNSDYDLLDELMDDDLRKEIGELSSDEESYSAVAQDCDKEPIGIVYNHPMNDVVKASPKIVSDSTVSKRNEIAPSFAQKRNQQPINKEPIDVKTLAVSAQNKQVMCPNATNVPNVTTHVVAKPTQVSTCSSTMLHSAQITVGPNLYIASVSRPAPVQSVMLVPSDLVYEGYSSVQSPSPLTNTATNAYMTMNNAPPINIYQTTQFPAPVITPLVIASSVAVPVLNNVPYVTNVGSKPDTKNTQSQNVLKAELHQPAHLGTSQRSSVVCDGKKMNAAVSNKVPTNNSENVMQTKWENKIPTKTESYLPAQPGTFQGDKLVDGNKLDTPASISVRNNISENDKQLKRENRTPTDVILDKDVERKILKEVQEKQTDQKVECKRSQKLGEKELKTQADQERLRKKRMAILDRKISHFCGVEIIALGYSPLQLSNKTEQKILEASDKKDLSTLNSDIKSPATPDSFKENKSESVQVRRILLRSSNKMKNKTSSPTTSLDRKLKASPGVADTATETLSENDQSDIESNTKQKRASKRIRNKSVTKPQDVKKKETNVLNKQTIRTRKPRQKIKLGNDYNPVENTISNQDFDTENFFDIEAELLGSTIPKIIPIGLHSPNYYDIESPKTEEVVESLISEKEEAKSLAIREQRQGINLPDNKTPLLSKQFNSQKIVEYSAITPTDLAASKIKQTIDVQDNAPERDAVSNLSIDKSEETKVDTIAKEYVNNHVLKEIIAPESVPILEQNKTKETLTNDVKISSQVDISDTNLICEKLTSLETTDICNEIESVKDNNARTDNFNVSIETEKTHDSTSKKTQTSPKTDNILDDEKNTCNEIKSVNGNCPKGGHLNVRNEIEMEKARVQTRNKNQKSPKVDTYDDENNKYCNEIENVTDNSAKSDTLNVSSETEKVHVKTIKEYRSTKNVTPKISENYKDDNTRTIEHGLTIAPYSKSPTHKAKLRPNKISTDSIVIEDVTSPSETNPLKKTVRIKLGNGKTFKGTVSGSADVDSILESPEVKAILMSQFEQPKKLYSLKLNVNKDKSRGNRILSTHILDTAVPKQPIETVSLLSDDEEEVCPKAFETEFGKHKISSMDNDIFAKHQNKFKLKCYVPLKKLSMDIENAIKNRSELKPQDTMTPNAITGQECVIIDDIDMNLQSPPNLMCLEKMDAPEILSTIPSKYVEGIFNDIENILAPIKNITNEEPVVLIDDSSNDSVNYDSKSAPKEKIDELKNMLLKDLGVADSVMPATTESTDDVQLTWASEAIDLTEDAVIEPAKSPDKEKSEVDYKSIMTRKCFVKLIRCDYNAVQPSVSKPIEKVEQTIETEPIKERDEPKMSEITKLVNRESKESIDESMSIEDDEYNVKELKTVKDFYDESKETHSIEQIDSKSKETTPIEEYELNKNVIPVQLSRSNSFSILEYLPEGDEKASEYDHDRSSPVMEVFETIASLKGLFPTNRNTLKMISIECDSEWMSTKKISKLQSIGDLKIKQVPPQAFIVPKLAKIILDFIQKENLLNKFYPSPTSLKRKSKPLSVPVAKLSKYDNSSEETRCNVYRHSSTSILELSTTDASTVSIYTEEEPAIDSLDLTPDISDTDVTLSDLNVNEDVTVTKTKTILEESRGINPREENISTKTCIDKKTMVSPDDIIIPSETETQDKPIIYSTDITSAPSRPKQTGSSEHLEILKESSAELVDIDDDIPIDCSSIDFALDQADSQYYTPMLVTTDNDIQRSPAQTEIKDNENLITSKSIIKIESDITCTNYIREAKICEAEIYQSDSFLVETRKGIDDAVSDSRKYILEDGPITKRSAESILGTTSTTSEEFSCLKVTKNIYETIVDNCTKYISEAKMDTEEKSQLDPLDETSNEIDDADSDSRIDILQDSPFAKKNAESILEISSYTSEEFSCLQLTKNIEETILGIKSDAEEENKVIKLVCSTNDEVHTIIQNMEESDEETDSLHKSLIKEDTLKKYSNKEALSIDQKECSSICEKDFPEISSNTLEEFSGLKVTKNIEETISNIKSDAEEENKVVEEVCSINNKACTIIQNMEESDQETDSFHKSLINGDTLEKYVKKEALSIDQNECSFSICEKDILQITSNTVEELSCLKIAKNIEETISNIKSDAEEKNKVIEEVCSINNEACTIIQNMDESDEETDSSHKSLINEDTIERYVKKEALSIDQNECSSIYKKYSLQISSNTLEEFSRLKVTKSIEETISDIKSSAEEENKVIEEVCSTNNAVHTIIQKMESDEETESLINEDTFEKCVNKEALPIDTFEKCVNKALLSSSICEKDNSVVYETAEPVNMLNAEPTSYDITKSWKDQESPHIQDIVLANMPDLGACLEQCDTIVNVEKKNQDAEMKQSDENTILHLEKHSISNMIQVPKCPDEVFNALNKMFEEQEDEHSMNKSVSRNDYNLNKDSNSSLRFDHTVETFDTGTANSIDGNRSQDVGIDTTTTKLDRGTAIEIKQSDNDITNNEKSPAKSNANYLPQTTDEIYEALNKMFGGSENMNTMSVNEDVINDVCIPNEISNNESTASNADDDHHNDPLIATLREGLTLTEDTESEILVESVLDMLSDEIIDDISTLESTDDLKRNILSNNFAPGYSFQVDVTVQTLENATDISEDEIYNENNAIDLNGPNFESPGKEFSEVDFKGSIGYEISGIETRNIFSINNASETDEKYSLIIKNDVNIVNSREDEIINDIIFNVPKHTYTNNFVTLKRPCRNMKRKKDMSDIKTSEKKYRKGKNIDYPKITASAITELAYAKEYKRIMDYCSTIKFSYARPFHIENIDVDMMHKAWPIQSCHSGKIKELNDDKEELLYTEAKDTEIAMTVIDPSKQTLKEEIVNGNNVTNYKSIDINETNFSMGFGERSGRVIQKIETGNTKLSAATLSDVKQYQPFSKSEISNTNLNIAHKIETQKVNLSHFLKCINMKEKVRSFFKKTSFKLNRELLQDKKYASNDGYLSMFPYDLTSTEFIDVPRIDRIVNVVQVGQLPVNTTAQNPVTCDPRVTHVSDVSPSLCSENSPGDDAQATLETEYTELTTANITLPTVQEYSQHHRTPSDHEQERTNDDLNGSTPTLSIVKIELMEEETSQEKLENDLYENDFSPLPNNNVEYSFEETSNTFFNTSGNPENTANNSDNPSDNSLFHTSTTKFDRTYNNMFTNSNNMDNNYSNLDNTPSSIDSSYTNMDNASTSMYSTSSNMGNSSTEMDNNTNMDSCPPIMDIAETNVNTININSSTRLDDSYTDMYTVGSDSNDNSSNVGNVASNINNSPQNLENKPSNMNPSPNMEDADMENTAYDYSYENIEDYAANMESNNNADNYYATNVDNYANSDGNYPAGVQNYDSNLENYATNVENYATTTPNNATSNTENNLNNTKTTLNTIDEPQPQDLSTGNSTQVQENEASKSNQMAHRINSAGIPSQSVITSSANDLVNLISNNAQSTSNNYSKPAPANPQINVMTLQQALAQVLPPPLNPTSTSDNPMPNNPVAQQVLHIVQGNNAQTVINKPNGTHLLHIVQNKSNPAANGLSLVDAGLQQGGNQLIHIVNNGNQNNAQFLKRVNLLTNVTNAQGSNEQKMIQFVCKSADGKSIQLNAGHQRSMVLRLHPTSVQTAPKPTEPQDLNVPTNAENSPNSQDPSQEIKSRSVYEENYAQFIQNSAPTTGSSTSPCQEKATSLPKFNQVFGKQSYQDNPNEINHSGLPESSECPPEENNGHLEQSPAAANNSPLLVRSAPAPTETSQAPSNPVQQMKQTMNLHTTMHGGVIYTRQIPVNIGGGQTINLITVPSTEMVDDSPQKQQTDGTFTNQEGEQSSIIKLVPHHTTTNSNVKPEENSAQAGPSNEANHNPQAQPQPQPQPVLTQMRIKLPMLSKGPHIVPGARLVRPSFFQIQRNVIAGTNQPVYQQLVLTTAPSLGQTIRLPTPQTPTAQSPQAQPILVQTAQHPSPHIPVQQVQHAPSSQHSHTAQLSHSAPPTPQSVHPEHTKPDNEPESELSNLTLEQLREFDMVLEQVKERSVQPTPSTTPNAPVLSKPAPADSTDGPALATTSVSQSTQQVLYSVQNNQPTNVVSYVNRKSTITSATTSFVRSPDSSGIVDTPSSSTQVHITHTVTSKSTTADGGSTTVAHPKKKKKKKSSSSSSAMASLGSPSKSNSLKPQEDEQTTQRILYILAEYKEQVENSPDKNKPAPRRRNQFPPTTGSKRKRSHCSSRATCRREGVEMSPMHGEHGENGEDSLITLGSEDSSCGTTFSECTDCQESHSPEDSPTKVVRRLTFEQETTTQTITQTRTTSLPQRNVIVGDGQTITVARTTTATAAAKPTTTVLMPANYLLPVSMIKGGQQIAIMTNRGPKILVGAGETNAGALLFQRLIGPGLKPVLARPGVRHIRLPATALHNLQTFNIQTTPVTQVQPPDSTAPQAPTPAPPDLVDTRAMSSPWQDREARDKPERSASPDCTEPWNLPSSSIADDYGYEEIVRTDNMERTVLDAIPDRYSPDMEAQRIFDKMFDVDSKKSMYDSPRCGYDIDTSDGDDKPYQQVVQQRKDGRHHRVTHVSTAALRHKYAILEHELRLQKSLSEECEDLGVDSPSASDLFPEADILFGAPSPAHEQTIDQCNTPPPIPIPQPDMDDQIATDQLLSHNESRHDDLDINLDDVGEIVTVGEDGIATIPTINAEEFAKSHPNTTFHKEPEEGEITIAQPPFTIAQGIKGRHITFHTNRVPGTVVMAPQTTVISQATVNSNVVNNAVKFTDIDNMINSMPCPQPVSIQSVLVKDTIPLSTTTTRSLSKFDSLKEPSVSTQRPLSKFDSLLTDAKLATNTSARQIVHSTGHGTQVIRRLRYDERTNTRTNKKFHFEEPRARATISDEVKRRNDRAIVESMGDNASSPGQPELFWDSTTTERHERRFHFSESEKVTKSPFDELLNDSSAYGPHTRLDSVIKAARPERTYERTSFEGISVSGSDESRPLRTYPPKRVHTQHTQDTERHFTLKTTTTTTHHHELDRMTTKSTHHEVGSGKKTMPKCLEEGRRRTGRGLVKRGCSCCSVSAPPKKRSRPKKPPLPDFSPNS